LGDAELRHRGQGLDAALTAYAASATAPAAARVVLMTTARMVAPKLARNDGAPTAITWRANRGSGTRSRARIR